MSKRSQKVILSPGAHVLRQLREKHRFSMKVAGKAVGCSDSYISQIENGRENVPSGKRLARFLKVYGGISEKYFNQKCREWQNKESDEDAIVKLLPKLKKDQKKLIRSMVEQMTSGLL